jgi:hypothetical protein
MGADMCYDDGSTLQTLHDQVHAGPGAAAVEPATEGLTVLAPWLGGSAQRLSDAMRRGGVAWSGQAADATMAALHRAAGWAQTSGEAAHTAATQLRAYSDSFAQTKPKIPAPKPVPTVTNWDAMLGVLGDGTDHAQAVADNANATEIALAAYSAHDSTANAATGGLPELPPPPQLTNPATTTPASAPATASPGAHVGAGHVGGTRSAGPAGTVPAGHPLDSGSGQASHYPRRPAPRGQIPTTGTTVPSGWTPAPRASRDGADIVGGAVNRPAPASSEHGGPGLPSWTPPPPEHDASPSRPGSPGYQPAERPSTRALRLAPEDSHVLTGRGPAAGTSNGAAGSSRMPALPPAGGVATSYHERTRRDRVQSLYDDLFGADDLTADTAPPVLGITETQP